MVVVTMHSSHRSDDEDHQQHWEACRAAHGVEVFSQRDALDGTVYAVLNSRQTAWEG